MLIIEHKSEIHSLHHKSIWFIIIRKFGILIIRQQNSYPRHFPILWCKQETKYIQIQVSLQTIEFSGTFIWYFRSTFSYGISINQNILNLFSLLNTITKTRIFKNYGHLTEIYNGRVWTRNWKIFSEQNLHALDNLYSRNKLKENCEKLKHIEIN